MGIFISIVEIAEEDAKLIKHFIWGLHHHFANSHSSEKISKIIGTDIFSKVIRQLRSSHESTVTPILRILVRVSSENFRSLSQCLKTCHFIQVANLLRAQRTPWTFDIILLFSNFLSNGNEEDHEKLFHPEIFSSISEMIHISKNQAIVAGLAQLISKFVRQGSYFLLQELMREFDVIELLMLGLNTYHNESMIYLLAGLDTLLKFGQKFHALGSNPVVIKMKECGHFELLEDLQVRANEQAERAIQNLLSEYFGNI
jgi:hypothetical protein